MVPFLQYHFAQLDGDELARLTDEVTHGRPLDLCFCIDGSTSTTHEWVSYGFRLPKIHTRQTVDSVWLLGAFGGKKTESGEIDYESTPVLQKELSISAREMRVLLRRGLVIPRVGRARFRFSACVDQKAFWVLFGITGQDRAASRWCECADCVQFGCVRHNQMPTVEGGNLPIRADRFVIDVLHARLRVADQFLIGIHRIVHEQLKGSSTRTPGWKLLHAELLRHGIWIMSKVLEKPGYMRGGRMTGAKARKILAHAREIGEAICQIPGRPTTVPEFGIVTESVGILIDKLAHVNNPGGGVISRAQRLIAQQHATALHASVPNELGGFYTHMLVTHGVDWVDTFGPLAAWSCEAFEHSHLVAQKMPTNAGGGRRSKVVGCLTEAQTVFSSTPFARSLTASTQHSAAAAAKRKRDARDREARRSVRANVRGEPPPGPPSEA